MVRWNEVVGLYVGLLALTSAACSRSAEPPASTTRAESPRNEIPKQTESGSAAAPRKTVAERTTNAAGAPTPHSRQPAPKVIELKEGAIKCKNRSLAAVNFVESCRLGVGAVHFGQGTGVRDDGDKYCRCVARTVRVDGLADTDCECPGLMDLRKFINPPFVEEACGEYRTF